MWLCYSCRSTPPQRHNSSVEAAKSDPLCFCQDQCSDCECRHIVSVSQNTYNNISTLMGGWGWQEYIITPTHTISHPRKIFIVCRENHNSLIGHNSRFNSSPAKECLFPWRPWSSYIIQMGPRRANPTLGLHYRYNKDVAIVAGCKESFTRRRLKSSKTYGCLDKI